MTIILDKCPIDGEPHDWRRHPDCYPRWLEVENERLRESLSHLLDKPEMCDCDCDFCREVCQKP